ncbi:MAG: hypothetical protein GVY16_10505 [Planctomycetes bacterium]|nr:hypothetical protein [Planctomycetota bacterium]
MASLAVYPAGAGYGYDGTIIGRTCPSDGCRSSGTRTDIRSVVVDASRVGPGRGNARKSLADRRLGL